MHLDVLLPVGAFLLLYGAFSGRLERTLVSAPMAFVGLGLGLHLLGYDGVGAGTPWVQHVAELTLVVVLFTDASRIDVRKLSADHDVPVRMLAIGLPLSVLLGALAAWPLFPGFGPAELAILAVVLAPTDAALGQSVVSSHRVPPRIRQAINVESGLNDGIALPALLFFVGLAGSAARPDDAAFWLRFVGAQLLLGPAVGAAAGYLGGRLLDRAAAAGWIAAPFGQLAGVAVAVVAWAGAEAIGGNGFLAAFVAGLALAASGSAVLERVHAFGEAEGQLLALATFAIFGAAFLPRAWRSLDATTLGYAAVSLTAVRMLPVALSLIGLRLRPGTVLFLGWFGPRGIASILYALIVVEEVASPAAGRIFDAAAVTVAVSVLAHGISARPASRLYARSRAVAAPAPGAPEHREVRELPMRFGKPKRDGSGGAV